MHNAVLETDDWLGRTVFGFTDPLWSCELPERNDGGGGNPEDAIKPGEVNVRIGGYFQFQDWIEHLSKTELRQWFKIDPRWEPFLPQDTCKISAHLRQG